MLREIRVKGYKAFRDLTSIEIKPITLIIGKNSSGKSSLLKLLPMLENMLSGNIDYPLLMTNKGISMGAEYEDLFYKRGTSGLGLGLQYSDEVKIGASYFTNAGAIALEKYSVFHGEQEGHKLLQDDKSSIHGLIEKDMFHQLGINEEDLKIKVNYIGPFRIPAPHCVVYQGQDNTLTVGYDGRGAYNILLNSYRLDKELYRKVSEWMGTNLEGQQLDFGNTANSSGVYNLQVAKDGYKTNMTGVGQGVAQVLPIITQSYIAEEGSINAIEQPALHLHPACHSCISYRLGQSAKERHCSYVIESHSENLLLGFRHLVVNPDVDFTPDDIVIYFVDRDEEEQVAFLEKITINDNGDLSSWPTGVFSEGFELLREINRMRR